MNKTLAVSAAIFLILAVVFAFADLPISQRIADLDSRWAYLMEAYGQMPGMLVGFLGGSVLLRLAKLEKSFKSIACTIPLFLATSFMGAGFWGDSMGQQVHAKVSYPLILTLSIVSLLLVQVWFRRVPDETMQAYKSIGVVAFWLFVGSLSTVWGIKLLWGRWTYRDMVKAGSLAMFSPWYVPRGINGHHSFISGHTALGFFVLPITLLFRKNKKHHVIAWVLAMGWGVYVAFSRVVIGAHFASDVLFGAGETLLWFWILSKRILKDIA